MSSEIFERIGRAVVEDAYEGLYEELGRQAIHGAGPQGNPAVETAAFLDERIAKNQILPRITDDLIERHKADPLGQHDDDFQRVLHYFQRQPVAGKYVIIETERDTTWNVGRLTGERGEPPEILEDESYQSLGAAQHAVFLKRIEELRDQYGEGE